MESSKTEILSFDEWFKENEVKFEYPRLAFKSSKMAWEHQQEKIDAILNLLDRHQYSSGERILKEVKELLK